jgi:hypothetical protein
MIGTKNVVLGIVVAIALSQISNKSSALALSSTAAEEPLMPLPHFGTQFQRRTQAKASKASTKAAKATVSLSLATKATKATKAAKATVAVAPNVVTESTSDWPTYSPTF